MATGNTNGILRVPGRVVVNPTRFDREFPFEGVQIGLVRQFAVVSVGSPTLVPFEGLGAPGDVIEPPESYVAAFNLRGWDDDAVRVLFANRESEGARTRHRALSIPGAGVPGASALARAVSILYVPDNPVDAPAAFIRRGVPFWTEGAAMQFARGEEFEVPLVVQCFRDAAGRVVDFGRLADLSI